MSNLKILTQSPKPRAEGPEPEPESSLIYSSVCRLSPDFAWGHKEPECLSSTVVCDPCGVLFVF